MSNQQISVMCPICLCDDTTGFKTFSCGHGMHLECMKGMGNKACPTCRAEIKEWPKELEEELIKNKTKYANDDVEHDLAELRTEVERDGVTQEEVEHQLLIAKKVMELNNKININMPLVMECTSCDEKRAMLALALTEGDADNAVGLILSDEDKELYKIVVAEKQRMMMDMITQLINDEGLGFMSVSFDHNADHDEYIHHY